VFANSRSDGLYRSAISPYNPSTVANTGSDRVRSVDISEDGQWLVYRNDSNKRLYLISPTGQNKTEVPVTVEGDPDATFPGMVRFFRGSPNGNEIVYMCGGGRLRAVQWSWNGSSITFGATRVLFTFEVRDSSGGEYLWRGWISGGEGLGVYGDQIITQTFIPAYAGGNPEISLPSYITIPNGGQGTSTQNDFYAWSSAPSASVWGCGHTISFDGQYVLSNAGGLGTSCVPCKESWVGGDQMDHKGFYITTFFRRGSPGVDIQRMPQDNSESINWCPPSYRYGAYYEVDFNGWSFSNHDEYVIGAQLGQSALKGLWIVHWPTNTWTLLTPTNNTQTLMDPAVYFTGIAGAHGTAGTPRGIVAAASTGRRIVGQELASVLADVAGRGATRIAVYSLSGAVLWQGGPDQARLLPAGLLAAGALVVKVE
jgi:hypothetical protein